MEAFIEKFHNLEGVTLSERNRNFHRLLNENASLKNDPEFLKNLHSNLTPRNYQESLLKVKILIFFHINDALLDYLKEGNEHIVGIISKHRWFFEEALAKIPPNILVNEVMNDFSYCVRMEVVKKLALILNGPQFDTLLDQLTEKYGFAKFRNFLIYCSDTKIAEILEKIDYNVEDEELIPIYKKNPELVKKIFDKRTHTTSKFWNYLFDKDFKAFLEFDNKYKCLNNVVLGRRSTKRLFEKLEKEDILLRADNLEGYCTILHFHTGVVARKLTLEEFARYINNYLRTVHGGCQRSNNLTKKFLQIFPKKRRYEVLKLFLEKLNESVEKSSIPETLLELLIVKPDEMHKFAKHLVDSGNDNFIKYLRPAESIPLIKEKINLTSKYIARSNLIKSLLDTCRIYNDLISLKSVLEYLLTRHKNEPIGLWNDVIDLTFKFNSKEFDEGLWDLINEIDKLLQTKFDSELDATYRLQYLVFLCENDKPCKDYIKTSLISEECSLEFSWKDSVLENNPKIKKLLFEYLLNNFDKFSDIQKKRVFLDGTLAALETWNEKYPDDKIFFYNNQKLKEFFFKDCLDAESYRVYYNKIILNKYIYTNFANPYREEFIEVLFKKFHLYGNAAQIIWFLKFEPHRIAQIINEVADYIVNRRDERHILEYIKKYSHNNLDKIAIRTLLEKLGDDKKLFTAGIVKSLSKIMSPDDYKSFAEKYTPTSKDEEVDSELCKIRCAIARYFKNLQSYRVVPLLLKYCTGHYLQSALQSLYSVLCFTPEKDLGEILRQLSKKEMSVRKHELFLACELCDEGTILKILKKSKNERNLSMNKRFLGKALPFFIRNPSEERFAILISLLNSMDKNDEETIKTLIASLKELPDDYNDRYFKCVWEFFESQVDNLAKQKKFKEDFIRNFLARPETIKNIDGKFCVKIIETNFLVEGSTILNGSDISAFVVAYVYFHPDNQDGKLKLVFGLISENFQTRNKECTSFFDNCRSCYSLEKVDKAFLLNFISHWEEVFTPVEYFGYYVVLKFWRMKFILQENKEQYYKEVADFAESVINDFGVACISLLAHELIQNLQNASYEASFVLDSINSLVDLKTSLSCYTLIALMLRNIKGTIKKDNNEDNEKLLRIVGVLEQFPDLGLQICVNYVLEKPGRRKRLMALKRH